VKFVSENVHIVSLSNCEFHGNEYFENDALLKGVNGKCSGILYIFHPIWKNTSTDGV
jgi:hypothetical protein